MRGAAVVLWLLAAPASAQDIRFSTEATEACLDGGGAQAACIGLAAEACMNATPDAYTTVGMGACLDRERAYWDDALNAAYRTVRDRARKSDAEMAELGSAAPPQGPELLAMQRAWIAFRDAKCAYEASTWGGGTGRGPAALHCLMETTAQQALFLRGKAAMY